MEMERKLANQIMFNFGTVKTGSTKRQLANMQQVAGFFSDGVISSFVTGLCILLADYIAAWFWLDRNEQLKPFCRENLAENCKQLQECF